MRSIRILMAVVLCVLAASWTLAQTAPQIVAGGNAQVVVLQGRAAAPSPVVQGDKQFLTAATTASNLFYGVNIAGLHPFARARNVGFDLCAGGSSQVDNWTTDAAVGVNVTVMSLDPTLPGIVAGVLVRPTDRFRVSAFVGIAAGSW